MLPSNSHYIVTYFVVVAKQWDYMAQCVYFPESFVKRKEEQVNI
jgi:hypothetical protein